MLAREEVKVREQAVKFAEEAAVGWRKREEAGMVAGIDVTRSEIQVAQTKNSLNSQQRSARNSLDRLMIAIGGGIGETPELVDTVPQIDDTAIPPLATLCGRPSRIEQSSRFLTSASPSRRGSSLSPRISFALSSTWWPGFNGSRRY